MDTPMNHQEEAALRDNIGKLTPDQANKIVQMVQDCLPKKPNSEVFEFELKMLPVRKCRELEKFVETCIKENQKREARREADRLRREKK
jgi:hypothetical protein